MAPRFGDAALASTPAFAVVAGAEARRLERVLLRVLASAVDGSTTYDLGAFSYDVDGPAAQRFPAKFLPRRPRPVVAAVEVSVASNQGAAATKLCRVRVH